MRQWLRVRWRMVALGGGTILLALAIGVMWGIADAREEADAAPEATSTTLGPPAGASTTTTDGGVDLDEPDPDPPGMGTVTTTAPGSGGSGGSGGSSGSGGSGGSSGTTPPNQPPVIVDAGLSSKGLTLTIAPTVADTDGDEVEVEVTVDGNTETVAPGTAIDIDFDLADVGYSHEAAVTVLATDDEGNETTSTLTHELEAVTTVVISEVRYRVQTPPLCFAETAAVRIVGTLILEGTVGDVIRFDEELRVDRTEVTLLDEMSGQTVGAPGSLEIEMLGGLVGKLDVYEETHDSSDVVLANMFADTECKGFFTYRVDLFTR